MVLKAKFKHEEELGALMLFFFMGSAGFYSGYLAILSTEETLGENALHLSISVVLSTVLLYYLYRFRKDKLYAW